jgi:hypothetical protein
MKKAALLAAGLFYALTLTAQESKATVAGNGKITNEKRDISDFTKLSVSGPFEVCLTKGDTGKVSLEGDRNILDIITTEISNGTLVIATKDGQHVRPSGTSKVKIKVTYTLLDNIALNGCGTINSKGTINSPKLKATVDGPGSINIYVTSIDAQAWILGAGSISIKGTAAKFNCKIVGSGTVMAYDLRAKDVTACISGSGMAKVNSTLALTGRIIGTGNIAFAGQPKDTDLKYMGTGTYSWE